MDDLSTGRSDFYWDRVYRRQADEVGADFEEYKNTVENLERAQIGATTQIQGRAFIKRKNGPYDIAWIGPYYREDEDEWADFDTAHTSVTLAMLFFRRRL